MKPLTIVVVAVACASVAAAERKVARKDLLPAVEQAVEAEEAKGAKVVGLSREARGWHAGEVMQVSSTGYRTRYTSMVPYVRSLMTHSGSIRWRVSNPSKPVCTLW